VIALALSLVAQEPERPRAVVTRVEHGPTVDGRLDEEFWRTATEANHLFWISPKVGNSVLEELTAQYFEKGDPLSRMSIRSQNARIELASYTRR